MNLVPEHVKKIDLTPDPFPHGKRSQKPNLDDKIGRRIVAGSSGNLPDHSNACD
jgi:hypothetical protein